MDETIRQALAQISTRYPDDGDEIWTQRVGWPAWITATDRADYEARRQTLWEEVDNACAEWGVEGVRVLEGRIVYAWTDQSVAGIQAAAKKAGDEKMAAICDRYFTDENGDYDRDAIWDFLDALAESDDSEDDRGAGR